MTKVDCDVLTGFLGSGKTTLLNAFLRSPAAAGTAVVVNEVGDIGIDQLVLAEVADNLLLLESGCLCCTLTGSLRETLLNLCRQAREQGRPLRRIVVETTGLAEPLPILHALLGDKTLMETVRLNQVVTTVDALQGLEQLRRHPESARQAAAADLLVMTKVDLAGPDAAAALWRELRRINPQAEGIEAAAGDGAQAVFTRRAGLAPWASLLREEPPHEHDHHDHGHEHGHDHEHGHAPFHARIATCSFYIDFPVAWPGIAAWWHLVSSHYGDDLLRCKGLLRLQGGGQTFIQGVGKYFHSPQALERWPDAEPRSRLVCIGSNLERAWLARSLLALRIDEPGVLPNALADLCAIFPNMTEQP